MVCHPINDLDLEKHRCAPIGLHQFETVIGSGDSDQLRGRSCDEFRLPFRVSRAANSQVWTTTMPRLVGEARITCEQLSVIEPEQHPVQAGLFLVPAAPPLHGDTPANRLEQ